MRPHIRARTSLGSALSLTLAVGLLGGCASFGGSPFAPADRAGEERLVLLIADLRMHLGDDTYRTFRHIDARGRNVFEVALRRITRLQHERDALADWQHVDFVLEFARARALERLRRYEEAAAAYARVSLFEGPLAEAAEAALPQARRFADEAGREIGDASGSKPRLEQLEERTRAWTQLAWRHRGSAYGWLALEEAESWDRLRIEHIVRESGLEAALAPSHELIERHRESKLFPRHVIRLADLHAELARLESVRGFGTSSFDAARYERNLDRALAAYELAAEARRDAFRREAGSKLEALLAYHQGVLSDAR